MDTSIPASDPFGIDNALKDALASGQLVIPPMSAVALELKRRIEDGRSGAADFARVIGADPAITGTVLRMANATSPMPITAVSAAIARVGTRALVALPMTAALANSSNKGGPLEVIRRQLWRESVVAALLAHDIGPAYGLTQETAFLCGLLHDVGRLVGLASAEHVLKSRDDLEVLPVDIWLMHIDRIHVEFGVEVAKGWKLPSPVFEAIRDHHQQAPSPVPSEPEQAAPALAARVDQLLKLLTTRNALSREDFVELGGLDDALIDRLDGIMAGLPARVAAFMGDVTAKRRKKKAAPSWTLTPKVLGEDARFVEIPVTVHSGGEPMECTVTAVAPRALRLLSPRPLLSGYLARAEFEEPVQMSLHLTVETTSEADGGHQIDTRPFSLSREQHRLWQQLLHVGSETPPAAS